MSRLSTGRHRGPITSTQIDGGNSNDADQFLSREERVFKRQLELAIEASKKSAPDQIGSSSENSQPETLENDKKRKNDELATSNSKSRKVSESSDDFNIDRAPWRFVMVPNEIHGHFVFMDINQDGLISSSEYYSVHRVFNYLGYSKYDKHNFM